MMAMLNVLLLMVLIVWLLDREDDLPRPSRVLQFRPRPPRVRDVVSGRPIQPVRPVRAEGARPPLRRPLPAPPR